MPGDTPLVQPSQVVSGQWEPAKVLHARPLTKEGRLFLGMKKTQQVGVIDPIEEGSSAGVADNSGSGKNMEELPQEEIGRLEAREFGEKKCEKTAKDWAIAQRKDETSSIVIGILRAEIAVADISDEDMPDSVDKLVVRRLVAQGKILELPDSQKLLVKRLSVEPAPRVGRNPGQYGRLLGEEPVITYVPLLSRPWVMDCTRQEAVHLGEK